MNTASDVSAVVLAGGRARRMGGEDKGLIPFAGQPMVSWVTQALTRQCAAVMISANRNQAEYARVTGCDVIGDAHPDYAGPLAGMYSALLRSPSPLLVSAPCDSPMVRDDLVARLLAARDAQKADLAVAHDGTRMQPVFALLPTTLSDDLAHFLESGGRKIDRWFEGHALALADFSDDVDMFANINTFEERDALQARHADRL